MEIFIELLMRTVYNKSKQEIVINWERKETAQCQIKNENNTTNMHTFQIGLFSFNLLRNVDFAGKVECILKFHSCGRMPKTGRVDGFDYKPKMH